MSRRAFYAIEHIKAINTFRIALNGNSFTKSELKQVLKDGKIPSNEVFINHLRKSILTTVGKDRFNFVAPKIPIYYKVLDKIYKQYYVTIDKYCQTYLSKMV